MYKKYVAKLVRLSAAGKNAHRQLVLKNHIEKLQQKLQTSAGNIKRTAAIACLAGGMLVSTNADAQIQFSTGLDQQIGRVLYGDPELVDIDNDGDLDILFGGYNGSETNQIQYSENVGTPSEPAFTEASLNTFGLEFPTSVYSARITSGDLDGDGDFDIIAADYYGFTHYFENTGTASAPAFAVGTVGSFGIASNSLGYGPSPVLADIDNDGDLDLFVNNISGMQFFENTGTSSAPAFAAADLNPFNLTTSGYSYANPAFSDMDGDGDLDLVMGGSGSTSLEYYENVGSPTAPDFAIPNSGITGVLESSAIVSFPGIGDLNNDGFKDIVVGRGADRDFKVYFHEGLPVLSYENSPAFNPFGIIPTATSGNSNLGYPSFTDLDNDGDQDMMVGKFDGGFEYYENIGSPTAALFASPVANAFGLTTDGTRAAPTFTDIDGDGDQDILTHNFVNPNAHLRYIENTGTANAPNFAAGVPANIALNIPYPGQSSKSRFVDLDGDGDQDLFVGVLGDFRYYENIGTTTAIDFGFQQTNPFGLVSLSTSESDLSPTFADLDGDGDKDLIVGLNSGDNLYYENTGTATNPTFASPITNPFGLENMITELSVGMSWYTPAFVDIDGDGDEDIIAGLANDFFFYENQSLTNCVVNIPDANFKAYLVGNTFINTNNDTEIQCSEASSYTQNIACDNCGISDLTGIEAFTQVQIVGVRNNQLTSVDLSANTSMIAFYANDNLLSNLSVSSNVNLTELDIADNEIASLDVSANTALVNLYVNANNLTSLDASSNTALRRLRCNDNELVSLNVANGNNLNSVVFSASGNPNLACIQVDDAAWSTTNWTDIDGTASFSENCATVGVEEEETLAFGMYPNPTSGELNFTSNEPIEFIEIFNQVDQQVAVFTNQNAVNISELAPGLYTVRITSGTKTGVQHLIKK